MFGIKVKGQKMSVQMINTRPPSKKVKQDTSKKIQRIANRQRGTKEREMREIHDDTGGKTD